MQIETFVFCVRRTQDNNDIKNIQNSIKGWILKKCIILVYLCSKITSSLTLSDKNISYHESSSEVKFFLTILIMQIYFRRVGKKRKCGKMEIILSSQSADNYCCYFGILSSGLFFPLCAYCFSHTVEIYIILCI